MSEVPRDRVLLEGTLEDLQRMPVIALHSVDSIIYTSEDGRSAEVYKSREGLPDFPSLEVTVFLPLMGEPETPAWPGEEPVDEQALALYVSEDGGLTDEGYDAVMDAMSIEGFNLLRARILRRAA